MILFISKLKKLCLQSGVIAILSSNIILRGKAIPSSVILVTEINLIIVAVSFF